MGKKEAEIRQIFQDTNGVLTLRPGQKDERAKALSIDKCVTTATQMLWVTHTRTLINTHE